MPSCASRTRGRPESLHPFDRDTPMSTSAVSPEAEPRDWGVPPLEPLEHPHGRFRSRVPVLDGPMMVHDRSSPCAAAPTPTLRGTASRRRRRRRPTPHPVGTADAASPRPTPARRIPPRALPDDTAIAPRRACAAGAGPAANASERRGS